MPPRIPQLQAVCSKGASAIRIPTTAACSRTSSLIPFCREQQQQQQSLPPAFLHPSSANFHTTSDLHIKKKNMVPDVSRQPWVLDRWAENKEAREKFRAERKAEIEATAAHVVWGKPTEFIERLDRVPYTLKSLDDLVPEMTSVHERVNRFGQVIKEERLGRINHGMTEDSLKSAIDACRLLSYPTVTDETPVELTEKHLENFRRHNIRATAAIHRIMSLGNGDSTDHQEYSKQLCISTFGRHNTDKDLPPTNAFPNRKPRVRIGPDTGSSEVQAAILTVRIRKLAAHVEKNNKDKHNKTKLRQLTHQRQKHLRYLRRKERGGERYQNVMEQLGLDDRAIDQELFM